MQAVVIALTLWKAKFVSEEEFIEWVDKQISESENLPSEYFDLSIYGPTTCLKWAEFEFPCRPKPLAFIEEFSLCATLNDLSLGTSIEPFIEWASRRCMGED